MVPWSGHNGCRSRRKVRRGTGLVRIVPRGSVTESKVVNHLGSISRLVQLVHDLVEFNMDRAVGAASLVGYMNRVTTNSTRGTTSCQKEEEESVPHRLRSREEQ